MRRRGEKVKDKNKGNIGQGDKTIFPLSMQPLLRVWVREAAKERNIKLWRPLRRPPQQFYYKRKHAAAAKYGPRREANEEEECCQSQTGPAALFPLQQFLEMMSLFMKKKKIVK